MKFFLDTVNLESIKLAKETGLINGITTNPTHLSKEITNIKNINIKDLILDICKLVHPDPVSVEVTETEPKKVYEQAKEISKLAPNIIVKIPCHKDYLSIIKKLVSEDIKLNITLLFSLVQGLCMCKLGVKYISPFIGRLEDIDSDGLQLIEDLRNIIDIYGFETQILAASVRDINHIHEVALIGADIITIPVKLFDSLLDHPLTDKGINIFTNDWKKLGINKFP